MYLIKTQKYVHTYRSIIHKICAKNIQICVKKIWLKKRITIIIKISRKYVLKTYKYGGENLIKTKIQLLFLNYFNWFVTLNYYNFF